jgi:glyoxalase family protein
MGRVNGLHHVTAIASDPQRNMNFYVGLLGLRLVKLTVNFDDPSTYHLYYGDQIGHPGTILTFFPWPGAPRGRLGTGQLTVVSFSIPADSISYWSKRFESHGVAIQGPTTRFDNQTLSFSDPDGLRLELVATEDEPREDAWKNSAVDEAHAIRGLFGVTMSEKALDPTDSLLTETLGFRLVEKRRDLTRFAAGSDGPCTFVDVIPLPDTLRGEVSVGMVHHVAWRTSDDEQQKSWRQKLAEIGLNVTPVIDRQYFRSIYFREPGGVLFEIATDPPGFTVDERAEELGTHLKLPPWLEPQRGEIERDLPKVHLPAVAKVL